MRARTELLLYRLDWMVAKAMRPTWRNLDASFESWAYGSGFSRQIQRLEEQAYLETRKDAATGQRLIRLTEKGAAAGGLPVDPVTRWQRDWDGTWRVVIFDVPERDRALRSKLRNRLVAERFGCLQQSVWISPDPFGSLLDELRGEAVDAGSLTLMEARPVAGETPADMARQSWNFESIGRVWQQLSEHLAGAAGLSARHTPKEFASWLATERELTLKCLKTDPLLPEILLPAAYPGRSVWKQRDETHRQLAAAMESTGES